MTLVAAKVPTFLTDLIMWMTLVAAKVAQRGGMVLDRPTQLQNCHRSYCFNWRMEAAFRVE